MGMKEPGTSSPLGRIHWIVDLNERSVEDALLAHARRLFDAGLPSLQLRAKSWSTARIVAGGGALRALARERGVAFFVNGDLEAAAQLDADGVHLPARGRTAAAARDALGRGAWVGRSAHDEIELSRAEGADWVVLAPVFPTRSKPGAFALGLPRFATLAALAPAPPIALGGIDRVNFASCFDAGAAGIAMVSALLEPDAPDVVQKMMQAKP
jgi:thiamine-phosphate diphosphorylase